ncbi:MAG: AEC family transporter [Erysipelotrichaceae bacterium]|nr:AEC family transporter [Erysipelotrichaceae bacterium]
MAVLLKSFEIVIPLLSLRLIGFLMKKKGLISQTTISEMNRFIVNVLIPVNIFMSIYNSDFKTDFNLPYVAYIMGASLFTCIGSFIIFHRVPDLKRRAAVTQASARHNSGIFGLPLAVSIYGEQVAGPAALGVAFTSPLYNTFAVITLESMNGGHPSPLQLIKKVATNPIIVLTIIAIILKVTGISLPVIIYDTMTYISKATTSISLLILGASFTIHKGNSTSLIVKGLAWKMIINPIIVLTVAALLGFRGNVIVSLLSMFAAPVAVSAYSMAAGYDCDLELTGAVVVYSYIVCLVTLPIFISVIRILGLI